MREERNSTAGDVLLGIASIPEPTLVPIMRATAPTMVPFVFVSVGVSLFFMVAAVVKTFLYALTDSDKRTFG